jgi:hypothetical protein
MQRWKLLVVIALVVAGSAVAAGGYAFWNARQNKQTRVWVPLEINPVLSMEDRTQAAGQIKNYLSKPGILAAVAKDTGIAAELGLASDEKAAELLGERLFVEVGEYKSPMGPVPAINIGFSCTKREFDTLGKAATRLMKDVLAFVTPPKPAEDTDFDGF